MVGFWIDFEKYFFGIFLVFGCFFELCLNCLVGFSLGSGDFFVVLMGDGWEVWD